MDPSPPVPTFFVIGASKSGTTSLHRYLGAHPEISMTEPKEPHLVIGPGWRDRVRHYEQLFADHLQIRGDTSPGYSHLTVNPDAPGNIAELVPEARLIYLVRDPVERAIAHYAEHVTRGVEKTRIELAIRPGDPANYYVSASMYATVLAAYRNHFDPERILVVDLDDLRDRRREALRRAFAHVGAQPEYWEDSFEVEHNVRGSDNVRLPGPIRRLQGGPVGAAWRRLPPAARHRMMVGVRRVAGREIRPVASAELRDRLAQSLAPEAERLREMTGQGFAGWSV